ncbi:hypothetical protein ACFLTB_06555 [Chloroflexota bacterium]
MRAQVSLIPTESKKLIAKAVANMDEVKTAIKEGIIVMHPSSSTVFLAEEITGSVPDTDVWMCGANLPKAACGEAGTREFMRARSGGGAPSGDGIGQFPLSWVIRAGKLNQGESLASLFAEMGPKDVYVKGVNAIDPQGKAAVLIGNRVEGGTIGRVMQAQRQKGFNIIYPTGLEKLIPISVEEAAEEAKKRASLDYSMGMPCSLLPCEGKVVTELKAIEILSGATAVPISAGGVAGAEGGITLVIYGEDDQVEKAIAYVEGVKGTKMPREIRQNDCADCDTEICSLYGMKKHWI